MVTSSLWSEYIPLRSVCLFQHGSMFCFVPGAGSSQSRVCGGKEPVPMVLGSARSRTSYFHVNMGKISLFLVKIRVSIMRGCVIFLVSSSMNLKSIYHFKTILE